MKKRYFIIICSLIIFAFLFIPLKSTSYDDGGTKDYKAMTYRLIKWNRFYGEGQHYNKAKIYFYPKNKKSVDDLWLEIVPDEKPVDNGAESPNFIAKVIEVSEKSIIVEPNENSNEIKSADKIVIPKSTENFMLAYNCFDEIKVGDTVNVVYDGEIGETYPATIKPAFAVTIVSAAGNLLTTKEATNVMGNSEELTPTQNNPYYVENGKSTIKSGENHTTDVCSLPQRVECYDEKTESFADVVFTGGKELHEDCDCIVEHINGKVIDISKNKTYFIIEDEKGVKYNVQMDCSGWALTVGKKVTVTYDGVAAETYPLQIHNDNIYYVRVFC